MSSRLTDMVQIMLAIVAKHPGILVNVPQRTFSMGCGKVAVSIALADALFGHSIPLVLHEHSL
jgi:hypothetical protein